MWLLYVALSAHGFLVHLAFGIKGFVRGLQVLEKSICKKAEGEREDRYRWLGLAWLGLAWLGPIALIASVRFFLNTLATATMNVLHGKAAQKGRGQPENLRRRGV